MTQRLLNIIPIIALSLIEITAQTRPEWTNTQKNSFGAGYYYGIGFSNASVDEADTRAFIEFSRTVEVNVKSIFQREVTEEGRDFSEKTHLTTELISDVSLKGIAITERWIDTTAREFYSLIIYRMTEYDSMMQYQIGREIVLMKIRNKMDEEKRQEEIRSQKVKNQIEEERKNEEIRANQEQLILKDRERELYRKQYGEFLDSPPPEKVISFRNGELTHRENSLMIKAGLAPLQLTGLHYAVRSAMFEIAANAHLRDKKVIRQEGYLKIQLLPGVGEYTRTAIAVGVVQAVSQIADSGYDFKRSIYSLFAAGNITLPEFSYSTISVYGDKRKLSVGITSFFLYEHFQNHLGFILEFNSIFDRNYRNVHDNPFVINAGVRLKGSDTFSTQLVYEEYDQLNLAFEFQF